MLREVHPHFREYCYTFDGSDLTSDGRLNVAQTTIAAHFPAKNSIRQDNTLDKNYIPNFFLSVDNTVLFNYEWLPIVSYNDIWRCRDMFNRLFYEYLNLTQYQPMSTTPDVYAFKWPHKLHTYQATSNYILNCEERHLHVNIDVTRLSSNAVMCKHLPHVEIYIGPYLVFSSYRDLDGLSGNALIHVLSFILQKMSSLY